MHQENEDSMQTNGSTPPHWIMIFHGQVHQWCMKQWKSHHCTMMDGNNPLKTFITKHIIMLQIHDEVEQMLLRCQLHGFATHNPFNICARGIVINCRTHKRSKLIKYVYLKIVKTLNNVGMSRIWLRMSVTPCSKFLLCLLKPQKPREQGLQEDWASVYKG
jgi:hypothetical protein